MRQWQMLFLLGLSLWAGSVGGAQVPVSGTGIVLTAFDSMPGGEYVYSYAVRRDSRLVARHVGIESVYLDVSEPKGVKPPLITGIRGRFSFDATRVHFTDRDQIMAHAPLFVGVPDGWFGFVSWEGYLGWAVEQDAVTGGTGFVVRSRALPALRYWTVQPQQALPDVDADRKVDSSIVAPYGYTLAPGWMASNVTARYLAGQLDAACAVGGISNCGQMQGLVRGMIGAEGHNAALERQYLTVFWRNMGKLEMHPYVRIALGGAVRALAARLP